MNAPAFLDRPDVIHQAVCEVVTAVFPTISQEALLSSEKVNHTTAWMRQTAMYLMADRFHVSNTETARHFGRDRTTVTHAVQLATQEAARLPDTAAFLDFLEARVAARLSAYAAVEAEWGSV